MIQIMLLRRLQQAGHKPIVLIGGGTSKIGDPSFKDEARRLMTNETIDANIRSIMPVYERFLRFGNGPSDAVLVNNADWLDELEYIPFLRDIGQHFSVNRMLTFESVKLRLEREQSLSFLEFNYMILRPTTSWSCRGARSACCSSADRINGATSSMGSSSAGAWTGLSFTA
jgi:tyrosyl-tRNA synthetase